VGWVPGDGGVEERRLPCGTPVCADVAFLIDCSADDLPVRDEEQDFTGRRSSSAGR
jgi:hypothetical protein